MPRDREVLTHVVSRVEQADRLRSRHRGKKPSISFLHFRLFIRPAFGTVFSAHTVRLNSIQALTPHTIIHVVKPQALAIRPLIHIIPIGCRRSRLKATGRELTVRRPGRDGPQTNTRESPYVSVCCGIGQSADPMCGYASCQHLCERGNTCLLRRDGDGANTHRYTTAAH